MFLWFARASGVQFFPGQTDPSASRSARPAIPAAPPCVQLRPDRPVVCWVLGFEKSVYIGFRLFVFSRKRSGQLSSMSCEARGSDVSWANRPVGVPSCPVPPRLAASPCAALRRPEPFSPWYVRFSDSTCNKSNNIRRRIIIWMLFEQFLMSGNFEESRALPQSLNLYLVYTSCVSSRVFPDMPCMKRVYRDKKASAPVHWSASRNKECFSPRG